MQGGNEQEMERNILECLGIAEEQPRMAGDMPALQERHQNCIIMHKCKV